MYGQYMARLLEQLSFRLLAASAVLALVIAASFGLLIAAIDDLRDAGELANHSRAELRAGDGIGELVIDLETGVRGFVITGQERFLQPWYAARKAFPAQARAFRGLVNEPEQARRAAQIIREGESYIRDYSVPLVRAVRRDSPYPASVAATAEGKRRVDAIHTRLDRFAAVERRRLTERQDQADADGRRAIILGIIGLVGSFALIAFFAVYLLRSVGRPIRRAAGMAGRLAEGDLKVRMPERGGGEIGALEHSFNVMADSLERGRADLDRVLREQGALRRVATLVAEAAEPSKIFDMVTREVGLLYDADYARIDRYIGETAAMDVAAWSRAGNRPDLLGAPFRPGKPVALEARR